MIDESWLAFSKSYFYISFLWKKYENHEDQDLYSP